jgi:hypothetical protein
MTILIILSVPFPGNKYIHNFAQQSPPPISWTFLSSQTETLCLLNNNFPVHSLHTPPVSGNYHSNSVSVNLIVLGTSWKSSSIYPFVTGLFHLVECHQSSSMWYHETGFPSFFKLNNITLHVYITLYLCIRLSIDIWIVSIASYCQWFSFLRDCSDYCVEIR